jgi:hypothetical protein
MSPIFVDYSNTHVLIAGCSEYYDEPALLPLQNVKAGVQQFHKMLLDQQVLGIPNENISLSLNESKKQIIRKLNQLVDLASKQAHTIIIYFAGYGVVSQENNKFYLVAADTGLRFLEDEGISIQSIKEKLAKAKASKKVLILDALYRQVNGGQSFQINAFSEFEYFDDVYIFTNSVDNVASFHDYYNPERPTFLTEKIIQAIYQGKNNDNPFLSTSEISSLVDSLFQSENLSPMPKSYGQSRTRDILFCKNSAFDSNIEQSDSEEDMAWVKAQQENNAFAYDDYIDKFPKGKYVPLAIENLKRIEEDDESWLKARRKNLLFSYREYLYNYPNGVHYEEALKRIKEIKINARKTKFHEDLTQALEDTKNKIFEHTEKTEKDESIQKKNRQKLDMDLIESFIRNEKKIAPSTQLNVSNEDLSLPAVSETEEIITESWAKLLVKQKNLPKAMDAYKKLAIKFPEKEKYYLAKANELKALN